MRDDTVSEFQNKVSELLIRHRSILDSVTKFQESSARVNRCIAKTVTACGCLSVSASRQNCPPEIDLKDHKKYMESHLGGKLCEHCREVIDEELGNHLFYLTALCQLLELELSDVLDNEYDRMATLGLFHLK